MAHFAEIDQNNTVLRVIVVDNKDTSTSDGTEIESIGVAFCKSLLGNDTNWKQTSYNGKFRKNYAGIGFTYDSVRDAFIPPKSFASWLLNENTCQWESPIPFPNDGKYYVWDETTTSWVEVT
jgi:hypothetical protein